MSEWNKMKSALREKSFTLKFARNAPVMPEKPTMMTWVDTVIEDYDPSSKIS